MKSRCSKTLIDKALEQYQELNKDTQYREGFVLLRTMQVAYARGRLVEGYSEDELEQIQALQFDLMLELRTGWGIAHPIKPDLELPKSVLKSTIIKPGSPLELLLYGFGITSTQPSKPPRKSKTLKISDSKSERELRTEKYFAYSLYTRMGYAFRAIGRLLKKDKDTIQSWVKEMEEMPAPERCALESEFLNAMTIPAVDVSDRGPYKLDRYSEENVNHNKGTVQDGFYLSEDPFFRNEE